MNYQNLVSVLVQVGFNFVNSSSSFIWVGFGPIHKPNQLVARSKHNYTRFKT